jgi:2-oxoisovalerate dehydrogenase E1 component
VIACPARPDDAAGLLRTCVAAAATDATLSVFLEPIALYHRRDLYTDGDEGWLADDGGPHIPIGSARSTARRRLTRKPISQLTMITFGNGVPMSLRVARRLAEGGIAAEVLDLRCSPRCRSPMCWRPSGAPDAPWWSTRPGTPAGVGEGVITALIESGFSGPIARVSSEDSFIPRERRPSMCCWPNPTSRNQPSHWLGWDTHDRHRPAGTAQR